MLTVNDVPLAVCAADGPSLARDTGATDLLGEPWDQDVDMIVIPMARFADDFFVLSTARRPHRAPEPPLTMPADGRTLPNYERST